MKLKVLVLSVACSLLFSANVGAGETNTHPQINPSEKKWTLYSIVNTTNKSSFDKYVYNFEEDKLVAKRIRANEYEKTNLINKIYHQDYLAVYDQESGKWSYKVHKADPLSWTLSVNEPYDEDAEVFTISFDKIKLDNKSIGEHLAPFEYSLNKKNPSPYHNKEWSLFEKKIKKAVFPKGSVCLKTIIDTNISEIAPLAPMIAVDKNMKDFDVQKGNVVKMFTEEFYNAVKENNDTSKEAQLTKFILDQETMICDYYNPIASEAIEKALQ